jgi:hypothetical protein
MFTLISIALALIAIIIFKAIGFLIIYIVTLIANVLGLYYFKNEFMLEHRLMLERIKEIIH